eukprot:3120957-Pleurochrysis_carterae.AAC.2
MGMCEQRMWDDRPPEGMQVGVCIRQALRKQASSMQIGRLQNAPFWGGKGGFRASKATAATRERQLSRPPPAESPRPPVVAPPTLSPPPPRQQTTQASSSGSSSGGGGGGGGGGVPRWTTPGSLPGMGQATSSVVTHSSSGHNPGLGIRTDARCD